MLTLSGEQKRWQREKGIGVLDTPAVRPHQDTQRHLPIATIKNANAGTGKSDAAQKRRIQNAGEREFLPLPSPFKQKTTIS